VFYINYLLLAPYFLLKKRYVIYGILSLTLIFGSYNIKKEILPPPYPKKRVEQNQKIKIEDESKSDFQKPFQKKPFHPRDFVAFYTILLVYAASITISLIQRWQKEEKEKSEKEKEKLSAELKYLKQQINPHFLFNALNSIYSLTLSNKSKASDAILKLSSILRYMLYESDKPTVFLKEELEILTDYIEVHKLRLNDKVAVSYDIIGEPKNFKIEPLLFLPVIENAFKYGADNYNDSLISIKIFIIDEKLELNVFNNIVVRPDKTNGSGIGIKNLKRRLDLLYKNEFSLNIEEKENEYRVVLKLKLKQ